MTNSLQQGKAYEHLLGGLALAGDARRISEFIEQLPCAVWAKDTQGRYLFANAAYSQFFELPMGAPVVGRSDTDFFSPEDAQSFHAKDQEIIRTGHFEQFHEEVQLSTGTKHVLTLKFLLRNDQGKAFAACGICFDISDSVYQREQLEQINNRLAQREQQLLALSRSPVIDAGNVAASLQLIVSAAARGLGVARVGVWLWDDRRESLQCILQHEQGSPLSGLAAGNPSGHTLSRAPLYRAEYPAYFAALDEQRTIAAHDAWQDPRTIELKSNYLLVEGIRSLLDTPIRLAGVMAGVLCCEQIGSSRQWGEEEASFAAALADMIGRSLIAQRRLQADQALRELNQQLEARVEQETLEARRAQAEAEEARRRLKDITDHMPGAVCQLLWLGPRNYRFLYVSEGIARITGVSSERFLRNSRDALAAVRAVEQSDFAALADAFDAAAGTPEVPFEFTFRARNPHTQRALWIQMQSRGQTTADGGVMFIGSFTDITQRKQLEDTVAESERLLKAAMAASHDGIWEWDLVTDAVHFSSGWFEQLGYVANELPMRLDTLIQLMHPDDLQSTFGAIAQTVEQSPWNGEVSYRTEFRLRRKDGRWQWTMGRGSISQRAADGTALRLTSTHVDIDERKQLEQSLAQATAAAQSASRAKGSFLANMSHEIRTPMNAVIGFAQLLRDTPLDARQQGYLDKQLSASQTLLALINDVLDLSRIEAGKLQLEQAAFSLQTVLDTLSVLAGPQAEQRGLRLQTETAADVPPDLIGDSLRLGQVLLNLVGNAIKFTVSGTVMLRVTRESTQDEQLRLRFSIRDTGIGIDSHRLRDIFQPFEQADGSTSRRYGGSGLGLAICRQPVELMGGEIGVESTLGVGSTFWFSVPFDPAATACEAALPAGAQNHSPLAGLRVLVAEDNDINLEILTELLRRVGVEVRAARNGTEAVAAAVSGWPQLVLMDMQMPEVDGLAATRLLRQDPRSAGLPVIALTANALLEDRARCLEAGMNDHLAKPIDLEALYSLLLRWRPR